MSSHSPILMMGTVRAGREAGHQPGQRRARVVPAWIQPESGSSAFSFFSICVWADWIADWIPTRAGSPLGY
eukprot:COSAG01_NODE_4245_length_5210_cov_1.702074_4_plen_71_part_00